MGEQSLEILKLLGEGKLEGNASELQVLAKCTQEYVRKNQRSLRSQRERFLEMGV